MFISKESSKITLEYIAFTISKYLDFRIMWGVFMNRRAEHIQIRRSFFIALVIICIMSVIIITTIQQLYWTQEKESKQYITEMTDKYRSDLEQEIKDDFSELNSMATYLSADFTDDRLFSILRGIRYYNKFINIGYVSLDKKGTFSSTSSSNFIHIDNVVLESVNAAFTGKTAVCLSNLLSKNQHNNFYFANPVFKDHKLTGALVGVCSNLSFLSITNRPYLNNTGHIQLIDSSGDFLLNSRNTILDQNITNIFDLKNVFITSKKTFKTSLANGKGSFGSLSYDGKNYWIYATSLSVNNWFVISYVPQTHLSTSYKDLTKKTAFILFGILLLFLILFIYIYSLMKKNREVIYRLAYSDSLTGLPNKNQFEEDATVCIQKAQDFALVHLNINNFKFFNELMGFDMGDRLLLHITQEIKSCVTEGEYYCRDFADHFCLLLSFTTKESLQRRLNHLLERISLFSEIEKIDYIIVCCCGVKIIDNTTKSSNFHTLLDKAYMALDGTKEMHKNSIVYFDEVLHKETVKKNNILNHMHQALENGEFVPYLQPKVNLSNGKIAGAEALVRWIDKNEKPIYYPDEFISIFEENGFIVQLDLYILEQVCKNMRQWMDAGNNAIPISVNQSRILFYQSDYLDNLTSILKKYDIPSSLIILEITETISIENQFMLENRIQELHKLGFAVSMDDFGSGFSSLNTLNELSIDELKIDRAFLSGTESPNTHTKRHIIIHSILQLSKELLISTVAEGIETKEQMEFLKASGCNIGQGYYFSKPLPIREFEKLLQS